MQRENHVHSPLGFTDWHCLAPQEVSSSRIPSTGQLTLTLVNSVYTYGPYVAWARFPHNKSLETKPCWRGAVQGLPHIPSHLASPGFCLLTTRKSCFRIVERRASCADFLIKARKHTRDARKTKNYAHSSFQRTIDRSGRDTIHNNQSSAMNLVTWLRTPRVSESPPNVTWHTHTSLDWLRWVATLAAAYREVKLSTVSVRSSYDMLEQMTRVMSLRIIWLIDPGTTRSENTREAVIAIAPEWIAKDVHHDVVGSRLSARNIRGDSLAPASELL